MAEYAKGGDMAELMMIIGAARGWCGAQWRQTWWWQDKTRALHAHRLLGCAPESMAAPLLGGGVAWIAPHITDASRLMVFGVCSDAAAAGRSTLDGKGMYAGRKEAPDQWVTWWDAYKVSTEDPRQILKVGDWVGGVTKMGEAVLGLVVHVTEDGTEPKLLQADEYVFEAPQGARWFTWRTEARIAGAKQLANERGSVWFPSYMAMRNAVSTTARRLLRAGKVQQDPEFPLKTTWSRRKGAKAE